jgi:hypothetical protein
MREIPRKNDLTAVKRQKRWIFISYGCLGLMVGNFLLGDPVSVVKLVIFCLFCISVVARAILVFEDGLFTMTSFIRDYVVRGGYGTALAFVRLVAEAVVGILLLIAGN